MKIHVKLGNVCEVKANDCHYTIYGTYYFSGNFCSIELLIDGSSGSRM